jgi:GNAT superfamily N-acetyltransferase
MTLRLAAAADHAAVAAFLRGHESSSLFPLANLLDAVPQTLWCAQKDGRLTGVLALNGSGFLMPQWPRLKAEPVRRALAGHEVSAMVGPFDQVAALLTALRIGPGQLRHDGREPLCRLDLADLVLPDARDLRLVPLRAQDRTLVSQWRMAYNAETWGETQPGARATAERDVDRWMAAGSHRLLWREADPVALTGLNARLPDVVQVGGVFVPPASRNQGFARRAVALHLAEARAVGADRAVLFAATPAALRAYQAIGFSQTGWMGIALLHRSMVPA